MKPGMATASSSFSPCGSGTDDGTNGPNWRHWMVSATLVGLFHVGLLTVAVMRPSRPPPLPTPPAMAIDLAPLPPPQPAPKVEPPPPTPQPAETRPRPRTPPPRQTPKPQAAKPIAPLSRAAEVAPAPPELDAKPPEPAPSPPPPAVTSTSTPPSNAAHLSSIASWHRILLQHLQSRKHYPRTAQSRRQEGIAVIRFVLDRRGSLLSARLERSSGVEILDEEAVDLLHRAQPLPLPPPEIAGDQIELAIPIEFRLK
ncbi:energy transducer TonB family protein [Phaeospirillum tilakii]|uniref:Energy transducer TonB n=1 Tax=Phaeospirillum tilakii TaxID=741673 RepID=A0ABW5CCQ3_9PROT